MARTLTEEELSLDVWLAENLFDWRPYQHGGWLTRRDLDDRSLADRAEPWCSTGEGMGEVITAMLERGFGFNATLNGVQEWDTVSFGKRGGTVGVSANGGRIDGEALPWHVASAAKIALEAVAAPREGAAGG